MKSNWSYSPETLNSGQNWRFFVLRDLQIWRMTSKNNWAPLLYHIKLYASFQNHMWIQTGVTVRKRLNWVLTSVTLTFDLWPLATFVNGNYPGKFYDDTMTGTLHTMDLLWEKFQWILPLYMKPISFQSKASVVCSVTAAIFIGFCLKKLNVFSQHIGKKTNEYLNSAEQIPRNWNVDQLSVLITSWDII